MGRILIWGVDVLVGVKDWIVDRWDRHVLGWILTWGPVDEPDDRRDR